MKQAPDSDMILEITDIFDEVENEETFKEWFFHEDAVVDIPLLANLPAPYGSIMIGSFLAPFAEKQIILVRVTHKTTGEQVLGVFTGEEYDTEFLALNLIAPEDSETIPGCAEWFIGDKIVIAEAVFTKRTAPQEYKDEISQMLKNLKS